MIDERIQILIREIARRENVESRVNGINALISGLILDARGGYSEGYREGYEDGRADAMEGGL